MRMAVQAGCVLAEEVDVLVSVGADDRERERRDMDDRARVPAGHHPRALLVQPPRLGVALDVAPLGVGGEGGELGDCGTAHPRDRTVSAVAAATLRATAPPRTRAPGAARTGRGRTPSSPA